MKGSKTSSTSIDPPSCPPSPAEKAGLLSPGFSGCRQESDFLVEGNISDSQVAAAVVLMEEDISRCRGLQEWGRMVPANIIDILGSQDVRSEREEFLRLSGPSCHFIQEENRLFRSDVIYIGSFGWVAKWGKSNLWRQKDQCRVCILSVSMQS